MSVTDRAKLGLGFAFQQPVRFKGIQVLDLIRLASGKDLSVSEVCYYLSQVGLCAAEYVNREVNSRLSGGELKRIEIATVLARDISFAVFDEPEACIDLWSFQNLIRITLLPTGNIKSAYRFKNHLYITISPRTSEYYP